MKRTLLGIFLVVQVLGAAAQMTYSKEPAEIIAIFDQIYNYRFREAEESLSKLGTQVKDPLLTDLAWINLHWWYLVSGDNERDHETILMQRLNELTSRLNSLPVDHLSQNQVFALVHAYAYKTRVQILKRQYLKGAMNLKQALDYLNTALSEYPRFDKYTFLAGLYHYFAAAAYDYYPLLRSAFLFAPESDKQLGFRLLGECLDMDHPLLSTEAAYFMMKIHLEIEEDFAAGEQLADRLITEYPDNILYHFHRLVAYVDMNQINKANREYATIRWLSGSLPHLNPGQRKHMVAEADRFLEKKKIKPFI